MLRTNSLAVALAFGHAAAIVILGYILLGLMPMLLFASGFIGGLLVWLVKPQVPSFAEIRAPYILTLVLFGLHKVEEREMDFFPALATITGVTPPADGSAGAVVLYALAMMWLLVPFLLARSMPFGSYLAWTLFIAMGVVEIAHFVFPLFRTGPYGYFPGMLTAAPLAAAAWWGIWRLGNETAQSRIDP